MNIAVELKKLLLDKNLTVKGLAKKMGKSQQTVNAKFLKNDFKVNELIAIADVLDYDVEITFKKREDKE